MPVRLILHADDFGLTPGINQSIIELFQAGALCSASLMATALFAAEAVHLASENPGLGVGCHLTFVDGVPASPPELIPTLLGADGKSFRRSMVDFSQAVLRGTVRAAEIASETRAQIQRLQRMGLHVTHVDTHKHVHVFPEVARTVLDIATQCGVFAVRNPFEPGWSSKLAGAPWARRMQMLWIERYAGPFLRLPAIGDGHLSTTEGTLGIAATGTLDETTLRATLMAAVSRGDGTWELCCHPAYEDADLAKVNTRLRATRAVEHAALLKVVPEIVRSADGPKLIHYGELDMAGQQRTAGPIRTDTGSEKV